MVVRCLQIPFQAFLGQARFSQIHQPCLTPLGVVAEGMYTGLYANFLNFDLIGFLSTYFSKSQFCYYNLEQNLNLTWQM